MSAYLTTDDMSAATGKHRDFWARLCKAKKLAGVKLGNDWRVPVEEFEAYMRGGQQSSSAPRYSSRQKKSA